MEDETLTIIPDPASFPSYDPALVMPLTTTFTPPCYHFVRAHDGTQCGPPEMRSVWGSMGYYSPGVCPEGYIAGCTREPPAVDVFHPFEVADDETAISCIPSGYTCMESKPTNNAYSIHRFGITTWAPAFEIRFKESDMKQLFTSTTSSDSTTSTVHSTTLPTATPTNEANNQDGINEDTGLPTGAVIGIAVGAAAGLAFFVICMMLRVRRTSVHSRRMHLMVPASVRIPPSLSDTSTDVAVELDAPSNVNSNTGGVNNTPAATGVGAAGATGAAGTTSTGGVAGASSGANVVEADAGDIPRFSFQRYYGADGGSGAESRVGRQQYLAELE